MDKKLLRTAFLDTVPVMTGYVFLGFGFGILMQQNGFGVLWAGAMSLCIYAGSMQYVAIPLLTSGASLLTAALTTFVVNARHLFYGISMLDKYKHTGRMRPYLVYDPPPVLCCRFSFQAVPPDIPAKYLFSPVASQDSDPSVHQFPAKWHQDVQNE